ncbi:hypothetical protein COB11_07580 [Candidatus Aerophobetes bacterium]|uniref:Uncharacterized protein n=1 Tax=Aerophobetes bacterium TaxID=2030807 RepID=A0A2A4YCF6_UNCAE|nr:MAG: hypothetical protein COB11_07580 [Candidatus Aerophobetes bacterium]
MFPRNISADLAKPTKLVELLNTLTSGNSQAKITFWGSRIITVGGSQLSLNKLTSDVSRVGLKCLTKSFDLSLEDRLAGFEILDILISAYDKTDEQLAGSNIIIKIIGLFQDIFQELYYGLFGLYGTKSLLLFSYGDIWFNRYQNRENLFSQLTPGLENGKLNIHDEDVTLRQVSERHSFEGPKIPRECMEKALQATKS